MKTSDAFPSRFMKVADLNGKEVAATISSIEMEKVGDDQKLVAYFKGQLKALVLNRTNTTSIEEIAGTDETDDWTDVRIVLYPSTVFFNGSKVPCVRIKEPRSQTAAVPAQTSLEGVEAAF
jgi:ABC-type amino acid transport substrate-binding protein